MSDIKQRINYASEVLSKVTHIRIEEAYQRILEAGRPRHDGTRERSTFENCTIKELVEDPAVSSAWIPIGDGGEWQMQLTATRNDPKREQFRRRAIWFWCLLFGHWEYYPKHA